MSKTAIETYRALVTRIVEGQTVGDDERESILAAACRTGDHLAADMKRYALRKAALAARRRFEVGTAELPRARKALQDAEGRYAAAARVLQAEHQKAMATAAEESGFLAARQRLQSLEDDLADARSDASVSAPADSALDGRFEGVWRTMGSLSEEAARLQADIAKVQGYRDELTRFRPLRAGERIPDWYPQGAPTLGHRLSDQERAAALAAIEHFESAIPSWQARLAEIPERLAELTVERQALQAKIQDPANFQLAEFGDDDLRHPSEPAGLALGLV